MSITLDLLIGPSKTLAKKLCPPSAPGYWVEAPPGEQFGIKLVSTAAEPLSATVFIDNVQIKSIVLLPGNSVVLEHCVVDYTPAGYEIRRCFIFSAPKVVAHNEVPTAGPLDSAAQLGSGALPPTQLAAAVLPDYRAPCPLLSAGGSQEGVHHLQGHLVHSFDYAAEV